MKYIIIIFFASCMNQDKIHSDLNELNEKIIEKSYSKQNYFTGQLYCYYVYQGLLDTNQITPTLFGKYIKGGTLSLKYIVEYNMWLNEVEGANCVKLVGHDFMPLVNSSNKEYAIFLNETAIKEEGKKIKITKNHERLHVAFALYKKHQIKIKVKWDKLSKSEKKSFIENHPGYNFKNDKTLMKEFFAYTFQKNIESGIKFIKY